MGNSDVYAAWGPHIGGDLMGELTFEDHLISTLCDKKKVVWQVRGTRVDELQKEVLAPPYLTECID